MSHTTGPPTTPAWDLSPGIRLASSIRQAAAAELGLCVSVGIAHNKLLAKLASRAAKPDGMLALDAQDKVQKMLATTSVRRLPGGGQGHAQSIALNHKYVSKVLYCCLNKSQQYNA